MSVLRMSFLPLLLLAALASRLPAGPCCGGGEVPALSSPASKGVDIRETGRCPEGCRGCGCGCRHRGGGGPWRDPRVLPSPPFRRVPEPGRLRIPVLSSWGGRSCRKVGWRPGSLDGPLSWARFRWRRRDSLLRSESLIPLLV